MRKYSYRFSILFSRLEKYYYQHDNEIGNVAETRRIPVTYGNSDDEDLAGSGEIEGSAGEIDSKYRPTSGEQHRGAARKYLIFIESVSPLIQTNFKAN